MSAQRFRIAMVVALVVAVAALAGVLVGAQRPAGSATAAAATAAPSPPAHPSGREGRFFGRGELGGGTGTVTGINGGTLTLRTLRGTLTVTTTSSTTYSKEGRSIAFKDIRVDDVVRVRPERPSGSSTPPASPPTTITAQSIAVVLPTFAGRVDSISGPTIYIVRRDGQLAYVYTTPGTSYTVNGTPASFGDVRAGEFISAEGTQTDLKHLTADRVVISTSLGPRPGSPTGPPGFPMRPQGGPTAPSSPTPSGTAT